WAGTWLGVFPSWETMIAQFIAAAFVIGSYYAAEWVKIKKPRRDAAKRRAAAAAAGGGQPDSSTDGTIAAASSDEEPAVAGPVRSA
ncbi:MAG: hypothetical protein Q7T55_23455, partial [Solirubrobacteraceae bacterium]|nr:hypothetical protein [Solirubrobacteraceae bacterium]